METFFNPKIEESIKELAFQLFKEEIPVLETLLTLNVIDNN